MSRFVKATKFAAKLKLAFIGPAGSGKTYSALSVGCHLAKLIGTRVAVIDTERGSASKYADQFDFDVLELARFSPTEYVNAVKDAEKEGYGVIIVDSLSHAWTGKEGALELKDQAAKREQGNTFAAWRHVTPLHNLMVDTLVSSTSHIIATMRVKTEYVMEQDDRGKSKPRKVGLAPVQRDGLEYEFDVLGDLDIDNGLTITKTRCSALTNAYIERPGAQLAETLVQWLRGAERPAPPEPTAEEIEHAALFSLIESAQTEAQLKELVAQLSTLPDPPRAQARAAYMRRQAEIRAAAPHPDDVGTERMPPSERGNAAGRAAVSAALGKEWAP